MKYKAPLLCLIFFLSGGKASSAPQSPEFPNPAVDFSKAALSALAGPDVAYKAKGKMNCKMLLEKEWAYPDAIIPAFCYPAETSCVSYDLFKSALATTAPGPDLEDMKASLPYVIQNVLMNLYGCAQALEASLTTSTSTAREAQKKKSSLPAFGGYTGLLPLIPSTQR